MNQLKKNNKKLIFLLIVHINLINNKMYYKWNDDKDNADDYKESNCIHGGLGKVETKHIKVLQDALNNYDDMEYDVEPAKEIMFKYLKNNKFLDEDSDIKDYGFHCFDKTLFFKLRDEKIRNKTYLFNTKTGEVYFINKTLVKHINFDKYNDYDKIISGGIKTAYKVVSDIQLYLSLRNTSM